MQLSIKNAVRAAGVAAVGILSILLTGSCGERSATAPQDHIISSLPIIKVDADHSHIGKSRQLIYEMHESPGFVLDLTGYKLDENKIPGREVIQVLAGKDETYSMSVTGDKTVYTISPPFQFKKGQRVVVAIGSIVKKDNAAEFYPQWAGVIDVK